MHLLPDPPTAKTTTANITDFLEADTVMVEQLLHDGFMLQDLSVMPATNTMPHTPSTDAPTPTDASTHRRTTHRCTHPQTHPPTQMHPPTQIHPPTQTHHHQTHPSPLTQRTDNLTPYSKKENTNHLHNYKNFLP